MMISRVIGRFKMVAAKWINDQRNTPGSKVWHRNYHDHVIRDTQELSRTRDYIHTNPVRWVGCRTDDS